MLIFNHISRTGLTQEEILERAQDLSEYMNRRFGEDLWSLQEHVDSVIDAVIEYNQ